MKKEKNIDAEKNIMAILLSGGIGVFPTDTLYGVIGTALKKETVERIYKLRKRELNKPMIILVSSVDDLKIFGIKLNIKQKKLLHKFWPGKTSIVFDCPYKKFEYLHRGSKTLAFRLPARQADFLNGRNILDILKKTGPLVAPSANIAGKRPAENLKEARKYFAGNVDFYADKGILKSKPSTLVAFDKRGKIKILREGAVKIN